jgi:antitoxin (DNA-binding transcriptional repressor) of toxin-antitoxin stability system
VDNVALLLFVLHLAMATSAKKSATRAVKKAPSKAKRSSLFEDMLTKKLSVGVRELRQEASKVLGLVKSGEIVIVTEWGKPVAEIRAFKPTSLQDLIDAGLVTPAKAKFDPKVWIPLPNPDGIDLLGEFLKERREARY